MTRSLVVCRAAIPRASKRQRERLPSVSTGPFPFASRKLKSAPPPDVGFAKRRTTAGLNTPLVGRDETGKERRPRHRADKGHTTSQCLPSSAATFADRPPPPQRRTPPGTPGRRAGVGKCSGRCCHACRHGDTLALSSPGRCPRFRRRGNAVLVFLLPFDIRRSAFDIRDSVGEGGGAAAAHSVRCGGGWAIAGAGCG